MKPQREDFEMPDIESRCVYTTDTEAAINAEIRRGGDPYKIARYFDVRIDTVLKAQRRLRIIAELLKKDKTCK